MNVCYRHSDDSEKAVAYWQSPANSPKVWRHFFVYIPGKMVYIGFICLTAFTIIQFFGLWAYTSFTEVSED